MKWQFGVLIMFMGLIASALIRPFPATASVYPRLRVEYTGRNLTAGGDWGTKLKAGSGDIIELQAILSNAGEGSTIVDTYVMVPLSPWEGLVKHPTFSLGAMNSGIFDSSVSIDVGGRYLKMVYYPGYAIMTIKGNTTAITPDTSLNNLTTQEVKINDIPYGDENKITINYRVQLVDVATNGASPTPTPVQGGVGGGAVAGTSAAVAKTNPQTGIGDIIPVSTYGWLAVGVAGLGLKKWAAKIRERTLV